MWTYEDVAALRDCPTPAGFNGYILGLDHAGVWADAKKGNH
jgi:hypothetical protein